MDSNVHHDQEESKASIQQQSNKKINISTQQKQVIKVQIDFSKIPHHPPPKYVVQRYGLGLTAEQLDCLKPGQWLDSITINIFINFLNEFSKFKKISNNNLVLETWLFSNMNCQSYQQDIYSLKYSDEILKNLCGNTFFLYKYERIFWLINKQNVHWYLIETSIDKIDKKQVIITIYNSMNSDNTAAEILWTFVQYEYENSESGQQYTKNQENLKKKIKVAEIPKQPNEYDCGIYALKSAEYFGFLNNDSQNINKTVFSQSKISEQRKTILDLFLDLGVNRTDMNPIFEKYNNSFLNQ